MGTAYQKKLTVAELDISNTEPRASASVTAYSLIAAARIFRFIKATTIAALKLKLFYLPLKFNFFTIPLILSLSHLTLLQKIKYVYYGRVEVVSRARFCHSQ